MPFSVWRFGGSHGLAVVSSKLSLQDLFFREVSILMSPASPNAERRPLNADRFVVRSYQPADRDAIRDLLLSYGVSGKTD